MKIAVIGSNGRVAQLVSKEALKRGFDVTGYAKGINKSNIKKYINKDALDLTKDDLKDFDYVVDAVGGWTPDTIPNITKVIKHLTEIISNLETRLIVVGGAGSLYINKERTVTVDMAPDFPKDWKPVADAHSEGLKILRNSNNLNWTYISPASNFIAEGIKTNEYKLGGDDLIFSSNGKSEISYEDYALALVDVIESGLHNRKRISVVSKN